MFDAKKLLDALVNAGAQAAQGGGQQPGQPQQGGLGGLLGQVMNQVGGQGAAGGGAAGGLGGMVGQVLGQLGQGAQQAGTAAGGAMDQVQNRLQGTQAGNILAKAREMAAQNPGVAGAVLGGLATLMVGSKTGRSVLGSAAALGGMALIGGLAYKAMQNYQSGRPLMDDGSPATPAPAGSGYEPEIASNDTAVLFIRAMIAAAAADGHIDDAERQAIVGGLKEAGFDPEANTWLDHEMANPASIEDLVAGVNSAELAAQVYTAARLAIEPDTPAERDFLAGLGQMLNLDAQLISHIDLAAEGVKG
jgi:uncharacterized membrane protein YebE (DUF533 family)